MVRTHAEKLILRVEAIGRLEAPAPLMFGQPESATSCRPQPSAVRHWNLEECPKDRAPPSYP